MKLTPFANIVEEKSTGLRMPETLARQIEETSKGLPADFTFRRVAKAASEFQLEDGSRTDVSTVTTDAVDHQKEVVLPGGIDFAVFRSNPVVPFAHNYDALPVGKCTWIKGNVNGVAAMTKYAKRPDTWQGDWLPDAILSLMQEGMCTGKSIGFIPTHMRSPTSDEIARRPELKSAQVVIDKSTLLEFSIAPVPCNPEALTVAVSKTLKDSTTAAMVIAAAKAMVTKDYVGGDMTESMPSCPKCMKSDAVSKKDDGEMYTCSACGSIFDEDGDPIPAENKTAEIVVPFVSPETLAEYRRRRLANIPAMIEEQARRKFSDAIDRLRGRV